jgi:hypothetical protein
LNSKGLQLAQKKRVAFLPFSATNRATYESASENQHMGARSDQTANQRRGPSDGPEIRGRDPHRAGHRARSIRERPAGNRKRTAQTGKEAEHEAQLTPTEKDDRGCRANGNHGLIEDRPTDANQEPTDDQPTQLCGGGRHNPKSHMTTKSTGSLPLKRGKIMRPQKVVLYGPEGVGKSTFASHAPEPVFLDTEGGTHHLDVARLDAAATWEEITAAIAQLAKADHPFKTLVIDTADWLEKRLAEHLCRKANKDSIEDFGYGKGWVILGEEFARFLGTLDTVLARGMHVVFLAHSMVRKFESPDQAGSFDRYELKLSKQAAPLLKEWADLVLFGNFVTKVAEKDNGKMRGIGGKERVLFANHSAAYDAKNRHGLPDKLPFAIESLTPVFGGDAPRVETLSPTPSLADRLKENFGARESEVIPFLIDRQQIKTGQSWDAVPKEYAERALNAPDRFLQAVEEFHQAKEVAAAP